MSISIETSNFYGVTSLNQTGDYQIQNLFSESLPVAVVMGLYGSELATGIQKTIESLGKSLFRRLQDEAFKIFFYENREFSYEKCPHGPVDLTFDYNCPRYLVNSNEDYRRTRFFGTGECGKGDKDLMRLTKVNVASKNTREIRGKICHRVGEEVSLTIQESPKEPAVHPALRKAPHLKER